jgi:hypothetical protein
MATGGVSGCNWAIASRFDWPGASSDGSGSNCAAGRSMTTGGVMVGLLVSRTTFSGHLRSDLMRIIALSMISGRSGKLGGGSGKDQPASNRRTASTLPTTTKYLAMGTADSSRDLSNPGQPMAAMLDHTHAARQIDKGRHGAASRLHSDDASTRGNSPSPSPRRRLPGHARWHESNKAPSRSPALPA